MVLVKNKKTPIREINKAIKINNRKSYLNGKGRNKDEQE